MGEQKVEGPAIITDQKRSCEEMNPHSQLLFTLLSVGSGFKVQGSRGGFAAFF